jgi:ParB family transcriptional regulator, chromosome partitioning protein
VGNAERDTFIHKADESTLGQLLVELVILQSARTQADANALLKEAADHYRVDTNAIALKVKQEFALKEKTRTPTHSTPNQKTNPKKKLAAA